MKRVNFTYEMAAKICELVEYQWAGDGYDGYEFDDPEGVRRRDKHVKTMERVQEWALGQMSKRLAKGYEPKED